MNEDKEPAGIGDLLSFLSDVDLSEVLPDTDTDTGTGTGAGDGASDDDGDGDVFRILTSPETDLSGTFLFLRLIVALFILIGR